MLGFMQYTKNKTRMQCFPSLVIRGLERIQKDHFIAFIQYICKKIFETLQYYSYRFD